MKSSFGSFRMRRSVDEVKEFRINDSMLSEYCFTPEREIFLNFGYLIGSVCIESLVLYYI